MLFIILFGNLSDSLTMLKLKFFELFLLNIHSSSQFSAANFCLLKKDFYFNLKFLKNLNKVNVSTLYFTFL